MYRLLPLVFLLAACSSNQLHVHNEYLTKEDLASMKVDTPDPRRERPTLGQRIMVQWDLEEKLFGTHPDAEVVLKMRFGDRHDKVVRHKITERSGVFSHSLIGEDYFTRGGIKAYKAELIVDGELVDQWQHQLWARVIRVGEN